MWTKENYLCRGAICEVSLRIFGQRGYGNMHKNSRKQKFPLQCAFFNNLLWIWLSVNTLNILIQWTKSAQCPCGIALPRSICCFFFLCGLCGTQRLYLLIGTIVLLWTAPWYTSFSESDFSKETALMIGANSHINNVENILCVLSYQIEFHQTLSCKLHLIQPLSCTLCS